MVFAFFAQLNWTMKTKATIVVILVAIACGVQPLWGSGQVGVYAIISKVVFEPNDTAPERIQLWGAFTFVENSTSQTLTPHRGYMYFRLSEPKETVLKEWADFKSVAGTGQAIAFGRFGYIGAFSDELISRPAGSPPYILMGGDPQTFNRSSSRNPVRPESALPSSPDDYPVNIGLVKLPAAGNFAAIVAQLQAALKK